MKNIFLFLFTFVSLVSNSQTSYDNLDDQSGGITNGYGSWGDLGVVQEDAITVDGQGVITFYHPDVAAAPKPTVFFISGWGRPAYTYDKLFYFIASQGYSVVNIYNEVPGNINSSYHHSLNMMQLAASTYYPNWINTAKVGLMGHSYGAGANLWLGKEVFGDGMNWGADGRFIFMLQPWYSLLITPQEMADYPANVKLLIEVSDDEPANDGVHTWLTSELAVRAAFESIGIPDANKDYIRLDSDPQTYMYDSDNNGVAEEYSYTADHHVSYTGIQHNGEYNSWDALDVYAVNRLVDAMMALEFDGDMAAQSVALGNGSASQINMGPLTDLIISDHPVITRPDSEYQYRCNNNWNDFETNSNVWFLQSACDDGDSDGVVDIFDNCVDNYNPNQQDSNGNGVGDACDAVQSLEVSLKTLLSGPFNDMSQSMDDNLRQQGLLPLIEPYTELGFTHFGQGGGEQILPSVLDVVGPNAIVDWIFVEIRNGNNPTEILQTQSALLQRDGDIVSLDGVSPLQFVHPGVASVVVALRHRSHLGMRSVVASSTAGIVAIDFTNPNTPLYGVGAMLDYGGMRLMYAGDANNDAVINAVDRNAYWRPYNAVPFSYIFSIADFDLNGVVNAVDYQEYWRPNNTRVEQLD